MFYHSARSLHAEKKKVENVEGDLKARKEKVSEVYEVEDQAFCISSAPGSTVGTLVKEVSSTRRFRRRRSISRESSDVGPDAADG